MRRLLKVDPVLALVIVFIAAILAAVLVFAAPGGRYEERSGHALVPAMGRLTDEALEPRGEVALHAEVHADKEPKR